MWARRPLFPVMTQKGFAAAPAKPAAGILHTPAGHEGSGALPYPALPYPTLLYPALPRHVLPCPLLSESVPPYPGPATW